MKSFRRLVLSPPALIVLAAWGFFLWYIFTTTFKVPTLPSFDQVKNTYKVSDIALLDRDGVVIHELRVDMKHRRLKWATLEDISPVLIETIIKVEDRRFYSHHGVDLIAATASAVGNLDSDTVTRGASTITMQLVSLLSDELKSTAGRRSVKKKIVQMIAALKLERSWSKKQILEAYLNLVTFRGELQGIRAAASGLFNKSTESLTQMDACVLAALISAPGGNVKTIARRAGAIAGRNSQDGSSATNYALEVLLRPYSIKRSQAIAPHVARILLTGSSTDVQSTLQGSLQRYVYEVLNAQVSALRERNVYDAAAVVLENESGQVLAYAGNAGYGASAIHVDGVKAKRQAGSTLKPFLYARAIERKLITASSILDDAPLRLSTPSGVYEPKDYDKVWKGPVSVRTALSSSLNVPAVRVSLLLDDEEFIKTLNQFGFKSIDKPAWYYGYALPLGAPEVTLLELTGAYRALATGGFWNNPVFTSDDKSPGATRVIDERAAFIISSILSDRASRALAFGTDNSLTTRKWSAVKTGTSTDMRDNWCIGYSKHYTVGVWVGNFSGEPMHDVTGVTGAAPVWLDIMNYLYEGKPSVEPTKPDGVTATNISFDQNIEPSRLEWYIAGTEPAVSVISMIQSHEKPHILYPINGTIIKTDSEIPVANQYVLFQYAPATSDYAWIINGKALKGSKGNLLWKPVKGSYKLSIADESKHIVDSVRFTVR